MEDIIINLLGMPGLAAPLFWPTVIGVLTLVTGWVRVRACLCMGSDYLPIGMCLCPFPNRIMIRVLHVLRVPAIPIFLASAPFHC